MVTGWFAGGRAVVVDGLAGRRGGDTLDRVGARVEGGAEGAGVERGAASPASSAEPSLLEASLASSDDRVERPRGRRVGPRPGATTRPARRPAASLASSAPRRWHVTASLPAPRASPAASEASSPGSETRRSRRPPTSCPRRLRRSPGAGRVFGRPVGPSGPASAAGAPGLPETSPRRRGSPRHRSSSRPPPLQRHAQKHAQPHDPNRPGSHRDVT